MFEKDNDLSIVTEVGVFGELDINDPTAKKVKKKNNEEDIDKLIAESIEKNLVLSDDF